MSAPLILVTRPESESAETAEALKKRGFTTLVDPVLAIKALEWREPDWTKIAGIFVTSKNALAGFDGHYIPKEKMFFIVGDRTSQALRAKGYVHVTGTVERSDDLPALARLQHKPNAGTFIHLTAPHSHDGFHAILAAEGFDIQRIHVYEAVAAHDFQLGTLDALKLGTLAAALFYSARSAEIFHELLAKNRLTEKVARMQAVCLSDAIAASCTAPWQKVLVAERPTQKHLLDCLANAMNPAQSST